MRILALLAVYNEEIHMRRCICDLVDNDIDVYVLDNQSGDLTASIAAGYLGKGVVSIRRLRRYGEFSLGTQLEMKRRIARDSDHDWIIHIDADERLEGGLRHRSLREGIEAAEACGCNCVNFRELVFVPLPGEDFHAEDYAERMRSYYLFEPRYPRLNRAWKRNAGLDNSSTGGHVLRGVDVRLYPEDFILRHYIVLSESHAQRKYLGRRYSDEDVKRGWHNNRLKITRADLRLHHRPEIKQLPFPHSRNYDLDDPVSRHFWEWRNSGADGATGRGSGRT